MKLDYREQGKVKTNMTDYLKKILNDLPDKYQGRAIPPASNHLFEVNETAGKLSEKYTQVLHTIVEKLIFLCKQARLDILTVVDFLTMQVREPDEYNGNKLARILKYLRGTRELVLALESDSTGTVKWWVDTAFVVHHGMNSHTGGMITMGKAPCTPSQTKKLNTRSSNEADLVGVDDLMPQILWM